MTTLVALSTKDALVMGCDSLATYTKPLVDPFQLSDFFDPTTNKLRLRPDGTPILADLSMLVRKAQAVPYNQMTHVDKLFPLSPLPMGVMLTGITSIGTRTVKTLIAEFVSTDRAFAQRTRFNYTVESIGRRLTDFLKARFDAEYGSLPYQPELELIIGGYARNSQTPAVRRLRIHDGQIEAPLPRDEYGIVFGGQMDWIQRIVFGTDGQNQFKMSLRCLEIVETYRGIAQRNLRRRGISERLPTVRSTLSHLGMFDSGWGLDGLEADWGDFSEQNAIECVDFFVDVMIKSQQFSERLPTVGGDVHVAVIRKDGFHFVSREALRHRDHAVSREGISQ